jgi:hypothetical protein
MTDWEITGGRPLVILHLQAPNVVVAVLKLLYIGAAETRKSRIDAFQA